MDQQILRMIQLLGVHDIIRTCYLCQHTLILTLTIDAITAFGLPMHAHHAGYIQHGCIMIQNTSLAIPLYIQ